METRRFILALALSVGILLLWQAWFAPSPPPPRSTSPVEERTTEVEAEPEPPPPQAREAEPVEPGQVVAAEAEETLTVDNGVFVVELGNRGGRVLSWRLNEYTDRGGEPLELVPSFEEPVELFPLAAMTDNEMLAREINEALFAVERSDSDSSTTVTFTWADGRGVEVSKSLTFRDGDYLVDVSLEVVEAGRRRRAGVVWGPGFGAQDPRAGKNNYSYNAVLWNQDGTATHRYSRKVEDVSFRGRFLWAGLEDQYFTALILPGGDESRVDLTARKLTRLFPGETGADAPEPKTLDVATVVVTVPAEGARLYIGPKKYTMLEGLGSDLQDAVWFSSNGFLAVISAFLFQCLLWIHDHTLRNYGLAIIITTVLLRLLLFPLNQWSMVSIKKSQLQMQRLQPKVNAIRNRYKKKKDAESRAKMNQEMMALYKHEGVNPAGGLMGCLPMLAQFPVLIGFYLMLTVAVELRGAHFFGWIHDLSLADPFYITPLLMGVTMFLQQRMSMSRVTDPTQRQQQRIMMIMPFFFTFICISLPSGLVLYWFVNNLLGIGQQWLVNKRTGRLEAALEKA